MASMSISGSAGLTRGANSRNGQKLLATWSASVVDDGGEEIVPPGKCQQLSANAVVDRNSHPCLFMHVEQQSDDKTKMMCPQEIAAFRADVAQYPGVPVADICNLRDDEDEPRLKTMLMLVACELLLRIRPLDLCKSIVAADIWDVPDSWYHPVCEAISFIEAEDRGELIDALNGDHGATRWRCCPAAACNQGKPA